MARSLEFARKFRAAVVGYTQEQVADMLGCSQATVSRMGRGFPPGPEILQRFVRQFELDEAEWRRLAGQDEEESLADVTAREARAAVERVTPYNRRFRDVFKTIVGDREPSEIAYRTGFHEEYIEELLRGLMPAPEVLKVLEAALQLTEHQVDEIAFAIGGFRPHWALAERLARLAKTHGLNPVAVQQWFSREDVQTPADVEDVVQQAVDSLQRYVPDELGRHPVTYFYEGLAKLLVLMSADGVQNPVELLSTVSIPPTERIERMEPGEVDDLLVEVTREIRGWAPDRQQPEPDPWVYVDPQHGKILDIFRDE